MSPPAISTIFPIKRILHSISMRSILNIKSKRYHCGNQVNGPHFDPRGPTLLLLTVVLHHVHTINHCNLTN